MEPVVDSREILAEERTLLAWLRTSLGIAGLGFVLDRFSLFMRAMHLAGAPQAEHGPQISGLWFLGLSLLVNVLAISRHLATIRAMRRAGLGSAAPQTPVLLLAFLLTALTAALALPMLGAATPAP
jgi:putative membrane protein